MTYPDPSFFTSVINIYFPEPHASLMNGILFGVELQTSQTFYDQIKQTGLLHIVVLSGINITLLGAIVGNVTKQFGKRISAYLTIVIIIAFVFFVGLDPPIVRAGIMGVITLLGIIYERKSLALYSLFLSGVIIALIKFEWIQTVSFQLSFGATLGIILFGSYVQPKKISGSRKYMHVLYRELKPSFASSVFTVPIIFYYFRQVSLIAPIANLLVAFVIPPLMILGLATAVLGKVHYFLGIVPAYMGFGILWYIVTTIRALSTLPYIYLEF